MEQLRARIAELEAENREAERIRQGNVWREQEQRRLQSRIAELEAELLRVRTHETAAAHALDCEMDPEERHRFKQLADENARLAARVRELEAQCDIYHADASEATAFAAAEAAREARDGS